MKVLLTNIKWSCKASGRELLGPSRLVVEIEPQADVPVYVHLDEYLQERYLDNDDTALSVCSYTWEEPK